MKRLNATYRCMNTTTDVLSFPMYATVKEVPDDRPSLLGDIVINPRAAKRQSARYNVTCHEEVRRLLIHGFLHLLGYDHEGTRYEAEKMRKEERRLQHALETLD
jgi:probable rRNA maturation factor